MSSSEVDARREICAPEATKNSQACLLRRHLGVATSLAFDRDLSRVCAHLDRETKSPIGAEPT
jgi:hypothetical protein